MNVTLSVDEREWKKFLEHCDKHGYGTSKRVMVLIKKDIEHDKER